MYQREVRGFRAYRVFGRDSLSALSVGFAKNTAGQRDLVFHEDCVVVSRARVLRASVRYLRSTSLRGRE